MEKREKSHGLGIGNTKIPLAIIPNCSTTGCVMGPFLSQIAATVTRKRKNHICFSQWIHGFPILHHNGALIMHKASLLSRTTSFLERFNKWKCITYFLFDAYIFLSTENFVWNGGHSREKLICDCKSCHGNRKNKNLAAWIGHGAKAKTFFSHVNTRNEKTKNPLIKYSNPTTIWFVLNICKAATQNHNFGAISLNIWPDF